MANSSTSFSANQADLFRQLDEPTIEQDFIDLDLTHELIGACNEAYKIAKRSGMTIERLVNELNRLMPDLNPRITPRKVRAWMARSKDDHPMPAYVIPAFCAATRCDLPLRIMAKAISYDLVDQRERLAQEFGQIEIERAALARKAKFIKNKLGE